MRLALPHPSDAGCAFIGMVHLLPLPGSPGWAGSMDEILERAHADAKALIAGGVDAIIVENMGDVPYLRGHVDPETTAAMAVTARTVVELGRPTGVQVLAGAHRESIGVALAAGASFIRVEAFAYAHVADEGWLDACAAEMLRVRRNLGFDVEVWADVQKKHASHAVTADLSLAALAEGHAFAGADALIVTGVSTGAPTAINDVDAVTRADRPVLVGSGVTPDNAAGLAAKASGLIVGSWLKHDGSWQKPVDPDRVRALRAVIPAI